MKDERLIKTQNRPTKQDTRSEDRPTRVPINGESDILTVFGVRPDYHPCWVNEKNVPRFLQAGYTFVDNDGVTFGSYHVNQANPLGAKYVRNVGNGVLSYLMEIPLEYYQSDRDAEERELQLSERTLNAEAYKNGLDHGDLSIYR